jgi:hypothetical protein
MHYYITYGRHSHLKIRFNFLIVSYHHTILSNTNCRVHYFKEQYLSTVPSGIILQLKYILLVIGLVMLFSGIVILAVSSFSVPDPLHTVNARYNGKISQNQHSDIVLMDVQKRKNISLYILNEPVDTALNAKIINPRNILVVNQNFSNKFYTNFIPTVDGNYTAIITNLNRTSTSIDVLFASSVLFYNDGDPKIFEIYLIMIGVIMLVAGTGTAIVGSIMGILRRYKSKEYNYS